MTTPHHRTSKLLAVLLAAGIAVGAIAGLIVNNSGPRPVGDPTEASTGNTARTTTTRLTSDGEPTTTAPATSLESSAGATTPGGPVTRGAGTAPGSAGSAGEQPAGFIEQTGPNGQTTLTCVGRGTVVLDTFPGPEDMLRICDERFGPATDTYAPPPPISLPPVPLHIVRADLPTGYGGIIGGAEMPQDQVSCQLTWFLTLSDGRVVQRSRVFPLAGLAPGTHSATWSSDPEFGAYPAPRTYTYMFSLNNEGLIGFVMC